MNYYVYVDWTLEEIQRPFYVGKGSGNRAARSRRNWKHRNIRTSFGLDRKIVFETVDEAVALSREIELIANYHTFVDDVKYNGIGCNFTAGGEGGLHPSCHTRVLIAESNQRRKGEKRSPEAKKRISEGIRRSLQQREKRTLSVEHKQHISSGLVGHEVSHITRKKLQESTSRSHTDPMIKQKMIDGMRVANQREDVRLRRSLAALRREHRKREKRLLDESN